MRTIPLIAKRVVRAVCAAALAAALSACGPDPTPDYRYRLKVEVETPEGLRTGSSVIEVATSEAGENALPFPGSISHRVRGEAVTVDLGKRGVLFALLRSRDDLGWSANAMFLLTPSYGGNKPFHDTYEAMLKNRREIALPIYFPPSAVEKHRNARPMLVTFRDLSDPTSVEEVDPDDLASTFGEGVSLKRITVQMTGDPVTTGIVERLDWLPDYYDKMLDGQRYRDGRTFANNLSQGDFSRGILQ